MHCFVGDRNYAALPHGLFTDAEGWVYPIGLSTRVHWHWFPHDLSDTAFVVP